MVPARLVAIRDKALDMASKQASEVSPVLPASPVSPVTAVTETPKENSKEEVDKPLPIVGIQNIDLASHELKAMLFGISGGLKILEELQSSSQNILANMPDCDYKKKLANNLHYISSTLSNMKTASTFGSAYIDGTLTIAKLNSGELNISSFDPQKLIQDTINVHLNTANSHGIQIRFKLLPDRFTITSDINRLYHVLNNLLVNALKFTAIKHSNGGGVIDINLKPVADEESRLLQFEVKDNGIGISKEGVEGLFQKFNQVHSPTTGLISPKIPTGTGMGLYTSKISVKQLEGEISCESQENVGSTFSFSIKSKEKFKYIPVSSPTPQKPLMFSKISNVSNVSNEATNSAIIPPILFNTDQIIKPKQILIVDDSPINQQVMKRLLEREGYKTRIVNSGQDAIQFLNEASKNEIDLILMDQVMPGLNGIETTMQIRNSERNKGKKPIPIIGCSAAETDLSSLKDMLNAGMDYGVDKTKQKDVLNAIKYFTDTASNNSSEASDKENKLRRNGSLI